MQLNFESEERCNLPSHVELITMLDRCLERERERKKKQPLSSFLSTRLLVILPFLKSRGHEICVIKYASLDRLVHVPLRSLGEQDFACKESVNNQRR